MKKHNNPHRNPIYCIIPPYIADKMGDESPAKKAEKLDNQLRNHRLRSDREFFATLDPARIRLLSVKKAVGSAKPSANVSVYSCQHGYSLPGKVLTGPATNKDKDVRNVYAGTKATWDFYYQIFKRNSVDNLGLPLVNSVHYGKRYNNAMWNGRQMVYGDGDKKVFDSFTVDVDIIGHELTHAVTQYAANLNYENQPGALNESFSDVFGIMIKQYVLNQKASESNWLIGENVMLGKQYALRSMIAPGKAYRNHPQWGNDPQPATMNKFVKLPNTENGDWGGVHYNSGIPNFAFCRAALKMGGYSWKTIGKVWYAALTLSLKPDSSFADCKVATIAQAKKLFKKNKAVEAAVRFGWAQAKV